MEQVAAESAFSASSFRALPEGLCGHTHSLRIVGYQLRLTAIKKVLLNQLMLVEELWAA
jgi:hypothetical protein